MPGNLGAAPKLNLEAVPEGQRPSLTSDGKAVKTFDLSSLIFTSHPS